MMGENFILNEEELSRFSFKDVSWLQKTELTRETALAYFSLSPFYDRTCNNEVLKMQTRYNNLEELHEFLVNMKGIEYDVIRTDSEAGLCFVIRKQNRMTKTDIVPIAVYYIIEGTIYQAPDFYSLLAARMGTSLFHLDQAFNVLMCANTYQPLSGYFWTGTGEISRRFLPPSVSEGMVTRRETHEFRERIENLVADLSVVHSVGDCKKRGSKTPNVIPDMGSRKRMGLSPSQDLEK